MKQRVLSTYVFEKINSTYKKLQTSNITQN